MKNSSVLARLLGRGRPAPVVSSLATAVLNRTLYVEPSHGESIIGGYLSGAITSADTVMKVERVPTAAPAPDTESAGTIGVINVSGGLVNRPMPGASGPGPANYATLRDQFDELLNDDSVSAIVFRIESPGGMASGCFDLTDHVFAARGKKPIHALIDDYAFSAAYALAAACDEIWVSRTGGVGSVGVCGFHEDWSGNNAQMGLKVTAVFAGARKIDFSQDFPLSDAAKARWQEMIDDDYRMFVSTIARYRGLSEEFVQQTEAGLFFGQKAVDAKIATQLGTWDNLVAHLGAPGVDLPDEDGAAAGEGDELQAAAPPAEAAATTDANPQLAIELPPQAEQTGAEEVSADAAPLDSSLEVAAEPPTLQAVQAQAFTAARAANLPDPVTIALTESVKLEDDVPARVQHAQQVIDLCKAAGTGADAAADPAPHVRKHTDIATLRADLTEAKAKADDAVQLSTTLPANFGRASAPGKWSATILKFGGKPK